MDSIKTELEGVLVLKPKIFGDRRGFFFEAFNQARFNALTDTDYVFAQDNQSRSCKNVLRGLHYQVQKSQGKLVRVISGEIYDVAVDIRKGSSSFGRHMGMTLSPEDARMLWIPPGFAHGFLVISDYAEVLYKTTEYYAPEFERAILWDDPDLAVHWPLCGRPILSEKDSRGKRFSEIEL